jgi:hypothetical protein
MNSSMHLRNGLMKLAPKGTAVGEWKTLSPLIRPGHMGRREMEMDLIDQTARFIWEEAICRSLKATNTEDRNKHESFRGTF